MTLKVIGLDLSLNGTGIAFFDGHTKVIKLDEKQGDSRLIVIHDAVTAALQPGIDLAVIEAPLSRGFSIHIQGMVHGVVRMALIKAEVPYVQISPPTLKAFATGNGKADKSAMILAAYKRSGREFTDDNECDAWWLRAAGLDRYGSPEVQLPVVQRNKLAVVKNWPALV